MESGFSQAWVGERLQWVLDNCSAGVDGLEASFLGSEASYMRLAESAIIQASDITRGRVSIRAVIGRQSARASTTDLSLPGLKDCVKRAVQNARQTPAGEDDIALPAPIAVAPVRQALDLTTQALDSVTKQAWLEPALAAHRADDLALAGRFHTGTATWAVHSTTGVQVYHQGSWADVAMSALERPAGHHASSCRTYFDSKIGRDQLNLLAEEVRGECHSAHGPKEVAPGKWDVVLSPLAVADLVEWLGMIAFNSQPYDDGTSFLHGRLGEKVTGDAISIVDDASVPHGIGVPLPFDVEGMPKSRVDLVTRGVAQGIVHNSRTGKRYGCRTTGHAQVSDDFPVSGSQACHLHIEPGEGNQEQMIQSVKRGLYVTRLHYVNGMIEPRRAVMTGLLRDAAFLIEDGQLKHAVAPMRFTDSILEAFDRIPGSAGVSKQTRAHCSFFGPLQCTVTPSLLIPKLNFTSGR